MYICSGNSGFMTKAELAKKVSEKTGLRKYEVSEIIDALLETIKESLEEGEPIYLRGFGTFELKKRAKKLARNISKNEPIEVPAHYIPYVKFSKNFIERIKTNPKLLAKLEAEEEEN